MKQPQIIHANYFDASSKTQDKYGAWVPARPLPFYYGGLANLTNRLHLAWLVFTGRCDALQWSETEKANGVDEQRGPNTK